MYQEKITEYKQAAEYMQMLSGKGIVLGLESMERLTKRMGRPQDFVKFVHVAGTNGKGSVLSFVSTILKQAGYRTGRYSSPVSSHRDTHPSYIQVPETYKKKYQSEA